MKYIVLLLTLFSFNVNAGLITSQNKVEIGAKNYITNGGFEQGTSYYFRYNGNTVDGAVNRPTNGTEGTPSANTALSISSSTPLFDKAMGVWTKSNSVSALGDGFSYPFSIDNGAVGKVLNITLDYKIASGTYATGDMSVWIYDVINSSIVMSSTNNIEKCLGICTFRATFQSAVNSVHYRLIFHTSSSSNQNYTLNFDNIKVAREVYSSAPIVGVKTGFTPTFSAAWGTISNLEAFYTRVGDQAEIEISVKAGTIVNSIPSINISSIGRVNGLALPSGDRAVVGEATVTQTPNNPATIFKTNVVFLTSLADDKIVSLSKRTNLTGMIGENIGAVLSSGDFVTMKFKVPIVGWTTNSDISNQYSNTFIEAEYTQEVALYEPSVGNPINYGNKVKDSVGAVTTGSNWKFTAPVSGRYMVNLSFQGVVGGIDVNIQIYKNGSAHRLLGNIPAGNNKTYNYSQTVSLVAGDYIDIRFNQTVIDLGIGGINAITIYRVAQPEVLTAREKVISSYVGAASGTPTSSIKYILATKLVDTFNSYNNSTGDFICPRSGIIKVSANTHIGGTGGGSTSYLEYILKKNGVDIVKIHKYQIYSTTDQTGIATFPSVQCVAGDVINVYVRSTLTGATFSASDRNFIDFVLE